MTVVDRPAEPAASTDSRVGTARPILHAATLLAVVVGMAAGGLYRHGAFYPAEAFGFAVASLALIVVCVAFRRDGYTVATLVSLGGLAAWWLVRANLAGSPAAFLPFGASVLAFLAAYSVPRVLGDEDPHRLVVAVASVGGAAAATGLAGVLFRWSSLATASAGVWRAAATLTYPAGAATLFIVALLVALALDPDRPLPRVAICLCLAGLIATQSRWELLALAGGSAFVPWNQWRRAWWPLALGLIGGVITVGAASGPTVRWPVVAGVVAVVLASMGTKPARWPRWPAPVTRWAVALAIVVVAVAVVATVVHPLFGARASETRAEHQVLAWSADSQAWRGAVWQGVGPARIGTVHGAVGDLPGFRPDAYLTVLAEGGLVGAALLLGAGASVAASIRRRTLRSSCAAGATVAFAVAGGVDFGWHLPALALVGGCAAGLAALPIEGGLAVPTEPGLATGRPEPSRWSRHLPLLVAVALAVVVLVAASAQLAVGTAREPAASSGTGSSLPAPTRTPEAPGRFILSGPDPTDPYMIDIGGRYFLYTSQGTSFSNVPLRTATRLGQWSKPIDVLPRLPHWAEGGETWAPDVHRVAGGWALYFTALLRGVSPFTHCIGSAFAASPEGPFVPTAHPFICQLDHRGTIDARVFVDTGNRLVMLFKSEDNANPSVPGPDQNGLTGIYAQHLSADGRTLLGPAVKILGPTEPWEGTIVEAPDMVEAWGTYWLFFSGNWYDSTDYGIGVAACQSAFGPCSDPRSGPLLGSNLQGSGPGESSLFHRGDNLYLLYNPFRADDPGPVIPRPVAMARLGLAPTGPYLAAP